MAPPRSLFPHLPIELLDQITSLLTPAGLNALMRTCRTFHHLLHARLLDIATTHTVTTCGRSEGVLTWAARGGHLQLLRQLIEVKGMAVDLGPAAELRSVPMWAAVSGGHGCVVRYLRRRGARAPEMVMAPGEVFCPVEEW